MIVEHGREEGYPQTTVFKYDPDGNKVPVLTVYEFGNGMRFNHSGGTGNNFHFPRSVWPCDWAHLFRCRYGIDNVETKEL